MAKKHRNLIGAICDPANLRAAYHRAARSKRMTHAYLEFKEFAEVNLAQLGEEMASGTYRPDPTRNFIIYEPKARRISAQSFRDRVAQQALVHVIGPIFEATLLPRTFACRPGRGTHAGVRALQADMRRLPGPLYALKTDFSAYFHNIDRGILHLLIRQKISCAATLRLITAITPRQGVGLPIGSLTSQLYANVYAGQVDRFLQCEARQKYWYRYMDDIVVLGRDVDALHELRLELARYSHSHLGLTFSKWSVAPVSRGVNFLGYRIWPNHKLLRRQSVVRARRVITALRERGATERLHAFLAAWIGHAKWADAHNLLRSLNLENDHVADQHPRRP